MREYWIVDPDRNRITVYDFESEDTQDYTFSSAVKVSIYEDLIIDFSELAGLLDLWAIPKVRMTLYIPPFPLLRRPEIPAA